MKIRFLTFSCLLILTTSMAIPSNTWANPTIPDTLQSLPGHWQLLPQTDRPIMKNLADLCLYKDQIHVAGRLIKPTAEFQDEGPWSAAVWQDTIWSPIDTTLQGQGVALATDGDRLALAMRPTDQYGIIKDDHSIHLLDNGHWHALGNDINGEIHALVFWRDMLVMGGSFTLEDRSKSVNLAVWRDDQWQPLGGGVGGVAVPRVEALEVIDGDLWVAGRFETAGRQKVSNIGAWDGRIWRTLHGGVDDMATTLTAVPDGVAVAGIFSRAGGVSTPGLALYDGQGWKALPEFPKDPERHGRRGPTCPTKSIEALTTWQGDLVALGGFNFPVDDGGRVHGAAVLQDGRWRVLPGSEMWKCRMLRTPSNQSYDLMSLTKPIPTPELYEPEEPRSSSWLSLSACSVGPDLIVGGALNRSGHAGAFIARAGPGAELISTPPMEIYRPKLGSWRGYLLAYGIGGGDLGTTEDLAFHDGHGWTPLGDWHGESGLSGGGVAAVTTWRGDLVVAGPFHHVADQVVRHVAAFDGKNWRPLGDGIPIDTLAKAFLWPRSHDLLLFCTTNRGITHSSAITCWRWDDQAWTRLALPDSSSKHSGMFRLAGEGDLLWAEGIRLLPGMANGKMRNMEMALYRLNETEWELETSYRQRKQFVIWKGAPTVLQPHSRGQATTIKRWTGSAWDDALDRDLPSSGWELKATSEALLLTRDRVSYAWFDPGWGIALAPDHHQQLRSVVRVDERTFGVLSAATGPKLLEWKGESISHLEGFQPPAPVIKTYLDPDRRVNGAMPLAAMAGNDSLNGWWVRDGGHPDRLLSVKPVGSKGIRIEGVESGSVRFEFTPAPSTWYRLTGRYEDSGTPSPLEDSFLMVRTSDATRLPYWEQPQAYLAMTQSKGAFDVLVSSPSSAIRGFLSFRHNGGTMDIVDLNLEEDPGLFGAYLPRLYQQVLYQWRAPRGHSSSMPASLPEPILNQARSSFCTVDADSVVLNLVQIFEDPRFQIDIPVYDEMHYRISEDIRARYPLPISSDNCDDLPRGVQAWEVGDLAYVHHYVMPCEGCGTGLPFVHTLEASAIILDLRRPHVHLKMAHVLVPEILSRLGSEGGRWARQRPIDGKQGSWFSVDSEGSYTKTPVIVLIGPDTEGVEALMAEALARMDHVTLLGETTAPIPAVMVDVEMPWTCKVLKVPSGTWEAPDGRTLTDQRVEPDVIWPATDTEGLMDQAREIVAKTKDLR